MKFSKQQIFTVPTVHTDKGPADFETAVTACGYGKFHFLLLLICLPAGWSSIFQTTTMSFVFPAAHCDLHLSLDDKGYLNAATYLGSFCSGLLWGFLFDVFGRKKLLTIGFICDGLIVILSSTSQTTSLLVITKFLGGIIFNGPFAAFTSYLSEFQPAKQRARTQMLLGGVINVGCVALPALAWAIIPQNLDFELFNLQIHSWNIYLFICSMPSIIAGVVFIFMPESPKFLMSMGKNEEALQVFRHVYTMNTGQSEDNYPIIELIDEIKLKENSKDAITANRTNMQALKEGWQQMKPLFLRPHHINLALVILIQTLLTLSINSIRLWLPQIFQAINDYEFYHNDTNTNVCDALDMIQPKNMTENCSVNFDNSFVYISSMIVGTTSVIAYILVIYLVNLLGKKLLLSTVASISGLCCICIYFTNSTTTTITTSAIFIGTCSIATNIILAVIVDLFPTTLRTMTISLTMMLARAGAMSGNLIFPYLLRAGCAPPFFTFGFLIISCAFLTILLPNTNMKSLE